MDNRKKVLIIGAGASGLVAIKTCLDEGLDPICVERTDFIGGLWNYHESVPAGHATVFKSTIINTSKEMMCYSDFPIPKEFANFMHNSEIMRYFRMYADHFQLEKYIRFKTEVSNLTFSDDFKETGQWKVTLTDNDGPTTEVFDAVLVCVGHHADAHYPKWPGMESFKGTVLHSHDYRTPSGFEDKRILVVGIGNSGGDAAVELGRVAKQVFLSTRRGSWVFNRVGEYGLPLDIEATRRSINLFPRGLTEWWGQSRLNKRFDHSKYGLKPCHGLFQQHPMVNDELPNRILSGTVKVKADVESFAGNTVKFIDGTTEEVDAVILATGFTFSFPFIDKRVLEVKNNNLDLYMYVWPPELQHASMAFIGYIQPLGAINPISEMQCRWAARVFNGGLKLPPKDMMWESISQKRQDMAERYVKSQRHTIQVDYIPYMDELALHIGCLPDVFKTLVTDPKLGLELFFGPCTPYQYRLTGPGRWEGARDAMLSTMDRVYYPTKSRPVEETRDGGFPFHILFVVVFLAILFFYFF